MQRLAAADDSDGIFDPTVLTALHRAGYDRSFELLAAGRDVERPGHPPRTTGVDRTQPGADPIDWRRVGIDPARPCIT